MISISQLRISFLLLLFVISLTKGLEFVIVIESHVSCYGGDDGVASVNITNGVPPFKIYWPTIDSESTTAENLVAGIHNVSVKDSGNNEVTQFFSMLQPSKLEGGAYSYSSTSSCDKLGSISALAYGGTPPYVYSWQGQDLSVMVAQPSLIIFDEVLSPKFLLNDVNNFVDLHSASIEAFSGLWSIKIESKTSFKFSILCDSSVSPACIQSILYSGIQFWMWKEDSVGKFFVGLLDKNGDISENGYTEFSFTAGTWSSGFLDFSNIPQDSYSGIYIATTGAFHFHLDDIALLPKREDFVVSSGPVGSLQIGTPSAVYGAAGQYNVRIEDSNRCPVTLSLNINSVPTMQNKIKVDGQSLVVSTVGGTPPFRYNLTADLNNNTLSNQLGTFTNLIPGNYTIEVLDSRTCRDTQHVIIVPPFVPIPPPDVTFTNYKVINFFLGTLAGVFAIITVFLIVLVHKRRNDLRPHSLLFCQTILIGSLLGYVSAILALLNVSWSKGIAFAWTVDFAVTIIYGSMFAKSMQILKILDNFTKFVSIDTTDRYMAKVFSFIIVPELLLLIIWTSLTGSVLQKKYTAGQGEVIFWNIFLIYKGIVGLLASFVCFRMRYKFKEYLEIQQIAYCHYSLEVLLAFLLIFTLIARERYTELFIGVQSFSVSVIVTIPLLVIISPIVARAIKDYRDEKRTQKWRSLPMYS